MFLSDEQLKKLEFRSIGKNVLISDKASIYTKDVSIGDNVRIDDFCILSGKIRLGSNIHIGAYCALYGKFGIWMSDFTGLSPRCTIFSASDDFGGEYLISPMVPDKYTNVQGGMVILEKFVQVGAGSIIMPDLTLSRGVAIGAMSFVRKSVTDEFVIYAGNPLKFIKYRASEMLLYAEEYGV